MSTRPSFPLSPPGSALARLAQLVVALKTGWESRRVLGQLGALDDHMLRDIGITRQDIASSLAEPMFRDPTMHLAARAMDARDARRAVALEARSWPLDVEQASITQRAA